MDFDTLPKEIQNALSFERSNFVHGSCHEDAFYDVPASAANAKPGTPLRVESNVDTSKYLIPPAIALSRILYQSESLNGLPVPVSAIILWPYSTSRNLGQCPVVAWAHGTSGTTPDSAPSHLKNISQHFLAPYQIALQGYVVVATDYAGLGVHTGYSNETIVHEYLCSPSHANDIVCSVQAARVAFTGLSKAFVVIGHSQGGGAAWACAQRQAYKPTDGYLGAVAVSPVTNVLDDPGRSADWFRLHICHTAATTNPDLDVESILTKPSLQFFETVRRLNAGVECTRALFTALVRSRVTLFKPSWRENEHVQNFQARSSNGGKHIQRPLLVIHGESDPALDISLVSKAVEDTVKLDASSEITYVTLPQVTHNPALLASQSIWMRWIADRFNGVHVQKSHERIAIVSTRPPSSYHKEQNWYLQTATESYHAAGDIRPMASNRHSL